MRKDLIRQSTTSLPTKIGDEEKCIIPVMISEGEAEGQRFWHRYATVE